MLDMFIWIGGTSISSCTGIAEVSRPEAVHLCVVSWRAPSQGSPPAALGTVTSYSNFSLPFAYQIWIWHWLSWLRNLTASWSWTCSWEVWSTPLSRRYFRWKPCGSSSTLPGSGKRTRHRKTQIRFYNKHYGTAARLWWAPLRNAEADQ